MVNVVLEVSIGGSAMLGTGNEILRQRVIWWCCDGG